MTASPHNRFGVNASAAPRQTETDRRAQAAVDRMVAAGHARWDATRYVWARIAAGDVPRLDSELD